MLKKLFPVLAIASLISCCPIVARAQWVVHALSGTVKSVNATAGLISLTMADGSRAQFKTTQKTDVALDFDDDLRVHATPSSSFRSLGAHVVVYYFGLDNDRTAVSLRDLGPGPFKYVTGTVMHYDKHGRVLTIQVAPAKTMTFQVSDKAVVDTGTGVKEGNKFDPHKGDSLRVTAVTANGADEAVFIRRRRAG